LLIRNCTLEGAGDGIRFYVTPVWSRLADSQVKVIIQKVLKVMLFIFTSEQKLHKISLVVSNDGNAGHDQCYKPVQSSLVFVVRGCP